MIEDKKLIFHLDSYSFTYAVFHPDKNYVSNLKTYHIDNTLKKKNSTQITNFINNDLHLQQNYSKILGVLDTTPTTFIPESLFDPKNLDKYIKLIHNANDPTQYSKQKFTNCYSISTINSELNTVLQEKFKKLILKNFASILVDYSIYLNRGNEKEVFLNIKEKQFHITLVNEKTLIFYNQFSFDTINDFLYYFMNCIHVLKLNPIKTKVNIITNLDKTNQIFNALKTYIKFIQFATRPNELLYSNEILNDPEHTHHNILSQLICE